MREKTALLNLHNQMKEMEDEEQIEVVKRGVKEGARFIQRSCGCVMSR